jgi:glycosyltransferase involved in cell wall biosynthesis
MQIKISVIIPCHNSEKFITNTFQSVLSQTIYPDEIILIDDGSTDNTANVLKNIVIKHNDEIDLSLIKSEHLGPGNARNNGIKNAKYEWISFLDSDDLWEKNKIKVLKKTISENYQYNFFCHNEKVIGLQKMYFNNYSNNYNSQKNLFDQLFVRNLFSTSAVVCKKSLFFDHGFFREDLSSGQDYEMWLRLSTFLKPFFINRHLGSYILRKGSISSLNFFSRLLNELKIAFLYYDKVNIFKFIFKIFRIFASFIFRFLKFKKKL